MEKCFFLDFVFGLQYIHQCNSTLSCMQALHHARLACRYDAMMEDGGWLTNVN